MTKKDKEINDTMDTPLIGELDEEANKSLIKDAKRKKFLGILWMTIGVICIAAAESTAKIIFLRNPGINSNLILFYR